MDRRCNPKMRATAKPGASALVDPFLICGGSLELPKPNIGGVKLAGSKHRWVQSCIGGRKPWAPNPLPSPRADKGTVLTAAPIPARFRAIFNPARGRPRSCSRYLHLSPTLQFAAPDPIHHYYVSAGQLRMGGVRERGLPAELAVRRLGVSSPPPAKLPPSAGATSLVPL